MTETGIIEQMRGKRVLIWGYGREGRSTKQFLDSHCSCASISVYEGQRDGIHDEDYDYIVKSPGIVMKEDDPRYTSQTQLFLSQFRDMTIGITGTKGKSTTSSMLAQVLSESQDRPVLLVGNIGKPCLDYYDDITEDTIVVFEMSCHQLAHTKYSPHIALFLDFYADHLDYYGSMEEYFAAKANITAYQVFGDYLLVGDNVPRLQTAATVIPVHRPVEQYPLQVLGEHNQYDAAFVDYVACRLLHCDETAVRDAMAGYEGLPHRMQYIGERDGIRFYDDSISTIPEATIYAASSIPDVGTVIVGGMDRHIDYDTLTEFIEAHPRLNFICCYDSGARIYVSVETCPNCQYVPTLSEAVTLARRLTPIGSACVLSPAAPSYGYFKDYEDRGDAFKALAVGS